MSSMAKSSHGEGYEYLRLNQDLRQIQNWEGRGGRRAAACCPPKREISRLEASAMKMLLSLRQSHPRKDLAAARKSCETRDIAGSAQ